MRLSRRSALAALGGGLAMPYVRPSWAQGGTVAVYNWSDYIGETTLQDFTSETGIEVIYDTYSSAEEMEAKMLAGMSGYDVVVAAGIGLPRAIAAGIYEELDRARLPNWGNLDPEVLRILSAWDPGNRHAIPYTWGSSGLTFNLDLVRERLPDADLQDLGILLDPANAEKLADCGISVLDTPTDVIPTVLKYLGLDPDTANVADYDRVVEAFRPVRPYIRTFDNTNYLNAIPNGELCVVNTWSGDYAVAKGRAAEAGVEMDLAYYVPRTGTPAWVDCLCMPADAPNRDNGYLFLDYLLRPEVIAGVSNYTWYANANLPSREFIDPEVLNDPAVYPDDETIARMWAPKPLSEEQERAMTRAWQAIKAG